MTVDDSRAARFGSLGRGIGSLIDDAQAFSGDAQAFSGDAPDPAHGFPVPAEDESTQPEGLSAGSCKVSAPAAYGGFNPVQQEHDALLCAAKLLGAAAAGTVAIAACTLFGARAVLGMRVRGRE